jgi:hypothetical protein
MKNPIQMIKQCVANEEPYFVLRGKDICALPAIEKYYETVRGTVKDPYFTEEIEEIMKDFRAFRDEQATHVPD